MTKLRQLEYFAALADLRHFGRAAQAVHVSQPTLSQQIRTLEQQLGVRLVERFKSGVELTPVGRVLAERARRVLVEVRDLEGMAARAGDRLTGTLRFGVAPTLGPYLMPRIIAGLHAEKPDLRLHIREGIPDEQVQQLARGELDILLGPFPIDGLNLTVEPLFREPLHIVAPPDHPLAAKRPLKLADLSGQPVLSLDHRHTFHRQVAALSVEFRMELLRDYEGTSLDSVRQMVASGLGLAILPEFYVRSEMGRREGVSILQVQGWRATRSIAAAWRSGAAYAPVYAGIAERIRLEARNKLKTDFTRVGGRNIR